MRQAKGSWSNPVNASPAPLRAGRGGRHASRATVQTTHDPAGNLTFDGTHALTPRLGSYRSSAGISLNAFGHQGLHHDEATGLVYNRARMLHPGLGRFVQRDPLGYVDGMSVYQYVRSNPINMIDWDGQESVFDPQQYYEAWKQAGASTANAYNLSLMAMAQQMSPADQAGGVGLFLQLQGCMLSGIDDCPCAGEATDWLDNIIDEFMSPFLRSLSERARNNPIQNSGWQDFFDRLDRGVIRTEGGVFSRTVIPENLHVMRAMALNHLNNDLRNALMKYGAGDQELWECIGDVASDCAKKTFPPPSIDTGQDVLDFLEDNWDVEGIRDQMRDQLIQDGAPKYDS